MVKGGPVQAKKFSFSFAFDGGSPWRIVHEGKFSKEVSFLVGLKVSLLAVNDLEAVVLPCVNYVESVTYFALGDDGLFRGSFDYRHGVDDNAHIFLIEGLEEDGFLDEFSDGILGLCIFWDNIWKVISFFVELAKDFSTDTLSTIFLFHFLLLFFL
jgi:hypothetical protein